MSVDGLRSLVITLIACISFWVGFFGVFMLWFDKKG